jgi:hypothetical protein
VEIWRDRFIQDASEELARAFWERLSPEPNQVNRDKLDLGTFYMLRLPGSVVHCRQDRSLPAGSFHPRMSARLGAFRLLEIDGSHQVLFTRPAELAETIIAAAAR